MTLSMKWLVRSAVIEALLLRERLESSVGYNPFSRSLARDPYPTYARLRRRDPVHRSRLINALVFTRYADVDAILRDNRNFSSDPRKRPLTRKEQARMPDTGDYTMLFHDPPDHTRLRTLVNKAFTSRAVNALEPRIRTHTHALLDAVDDPSRFDLMEALAKQLPVIVIAEMLGVPPEDRREFGIWSNQRARLLEPTVSERERQIALDAQKAFDAYFRPIIEVRRTEPRDDILSGLVQAEEQGDRLSEQELLTMLRMILIAGHETTTNLIGNGMLALLRHPDQLQALRDDPGLIPGAVHELLRYDAPVQTDFRFALQDCEVRGTRLRKFQSAVLLLGAANRDPEAFSDPERFDIRRDDANHIAFGRGVHYCLGASLALLEGRVVFETLLERFSEIRLRDAQPKFRSAIVLRGLESLSVAATPAGSA